MSKRIRLIKTMIILSVMLVLGAIGLHSAFSGQLDPPAPPGPTMYTLEEIYNFRVWKMSGKTFVNHPGNSRFAVHDPSTPGDSSDDLVLDKDTGLIWARDAGLLTGPQLPEDAVIACRNVDLGNRKGWRIPSVEELSSLIDLSVAGSPVLPAGHPFVNVQFDPGEPMYYWTDATRVGVFEGFAYAVNMADGDITDGLDLGDTAYVWPVWGGKSSGF